MGRIMRIIDAVSSVLGTTPAEYAAMAARGEYPGQSAQAQRPRYADPYSGVRVHGTDPTGINMQNAMFDTLGRVNAQQRGSSDPYSGVRVHGTDPTGINMQNAMFDAMGGNRRV